MTPKRQRMWTLIVCAVALCTGLGLVLHSFSKHLIYFYTPTQLHAASTMPEQIIRVGGMVEVGSIQKTGEQSVRFVITDLTQTITATYDGLLPTLFREGQGVVAQGTLTPDGELHAATILAKHDENYMPKEVVDALKASGRWQAYSDANKKAYAP